MALPPLRPLDWFAVQQDGDLAFCLRDPENIQEEPLLLRPEAFVVAQYLDGNNDIVDIQAALARRFYGAIVPSEFIQAVAEKLSDLLLLNDERYRKARAAIEKTFREQAARKAFLAGRSYPAEAGELSAFLEKFEDPVPAPTGRWRGLIAPHIDFHRGGRSYAKIYGRMRTLEPADTYVILGVAHASPPSPFVLTKKDFETPFGAAPCDREFIRRLEKRLGWDPYQHELVHRTEHSVEFQVVWLKRVVRQPFRIVPILCSSFDLKDGRDPREAPRVEEFIGALQSVIAEGKERVCVVSGADLAHVGRRFGDDFDITEEVVERIRREDEDSLRAALKGDADGFYRSIQDDGNRRKVCGITSIYTALRLLDGARGELIDYDSAPDPAGGIVSFAALAFPE